jgi:hypothetical protein
MKTKIPFLLLFNCFIIFPVFAQHLNYKSVSNEDLTYVLNNIEKHITLKNNADTLFINVYMVSDPSGSAGIPEGEEITNTIYIAVSEDGEAPEQNLFKLTSVYNPKIVSWNTAAIRPQIVLAYGPFDKRKKATISISLKGLTINKQ